MTWAMRGEDRNAPAVLKRRSRSLSISRAGLEGTAARYWSEVRIAAREAVREHVPDCQTARQPDSGTANSQTANSQTARLRQPHQADARVLSPPSVTFLALPGLTLPSPPLPSPALPSPTAAPLQQKGTGAF